MIKVIFTNNVSRKSFMVAEDSTIREAMESNDIAYGSGMLSIDGASLCPGDIDNTFADLGITDHCYLAQVVKADNAAVMKVIGKTAFLVSEHDLEEVKNAVKYAGKEAMSITDEDDEVVFAVGVSKTGKGYANKYGVTFDATPNAEGKAICTIDLPEEADQDYLVDTFGTTIDYLGKVDEKMTEALAGVMATRAAVAERIVTL